jgi:hypothetical protein
MFDVAGRRSPQMRARDADRDATCRILDVALADGQLSGDEHRQRVAAATTATTLGDLDGLIGDLQSNAPAVPPQRGGRRGLMIATGAAGVIAVAVTVLVAVNDEDPPALPDAPVAAPVAESPVAPTGRAEPEPSVVTMPTAFHTVEGMTGLLDTIRQRFGGTTGIELAVWKEDAMLLLPDPADPASKQLYRFHNGWGTPSSRPRDAKDQPVDLGAFDVPAVVEALRVAPDTLGIPAADVSEVVLDIDDVAGSTAPAPLELMVKVSSTSGGSGFVYLDRAGAVTRVEHPR